MLPRPAGPCGCVFVQLAVAAAAEAAAAANFLQVFCSVSRVSDVTLESFWVGFSDSFVLQGHGVLLFRNRPARDFVVAAVLRAVAAAGSSSSTFRMDWIGF